MENKNNNLFAVPPPPTRSHKIIQMKPRPQDDAADATIAKRSGNGKGSDVTMKSAANASGSGIGVAGSGADRKIARKTAHSLIERRQRSKINEEFVVLRNIIPACAGDMHKLAILQASVEYIRYLEDCVGQLKAQPCKHRTVSASGNPLPSSREFHPTFHGDPSARWKYLTRKPSHRALAPAMIIITRYTTSSPYRQSPTRKTHGSDTTRTHESCRRPNTATKASRSRPRHHQPLGPSVTARILEAAQPRPCRQLRALRSTRRPS